MEVAEVEAADVDFPIPSLERIAAAALRKLKQVTLPIITSRPEQCVVYLADIRSK
jgi:hypothetical protein